MNNTLLIFTIPSAHFCSFLLIWAPMLPQICSFLLPYLLPGAPMYFYSNVFGALWGTHVFLFQCIWGTLGHPCISIPTYLGHFGAPMYFYSNVFGALWGTHVFLLQCIWALWGTHVIGLPCLSQYFPLGGQFT